MTVLIILIAPLAGRFSDRFGSRVFAGGGMLLVACSLFLFSLQGIHADFWNLLPAMLVGGSGMALTMTPTTAAAMLAVRADKAGVGSAVLNSMRQVGGSLGIAIMGAIVASSLKSGLLAGDSQPVAFTNALHDALRVAAVIALTGSVVAVLTVRKPRHATETASKPQLLVEA
jgi:MFS family permease